VDPEGDIASGGVEEHAGSAVHLHPHGPDGAQRITLSLTRESLPAGDRDSLSMMSTCSPANRDSG